jgi:hypothetical protein
VQRQWRAGAILPNRRRWQPTTFTKNRDRLLAADVTKEFLAEVVNQAKQKGLPSDEHFMVDWTLIEAGSTIGGPSSSRTITVSFSSSRLDGSATV